MNLQQRAYESSIEELYDRINTFSSYMTDSPSAVVDWINKTDFDEPLKYYIKAKPHYDLAFETYKNVYRIDETTMELVDYEESFIYSISHPSVTDKIFIESLPEETHDILKTKVAFNIFRDDSIMQYLHCVSAGRLKYDWFVYYDYLEQSWLEPETPCPLPKNITYDINEIIKHNNIVQVRKKLLEELNLHPIFVVHLAHKWFTEGDD